MFFSIIVPCYNGEVTIANTLESVCIQTYSDFEVIVVNDGSTDSSLDIVKSYLGRLPLKIISQKNSGLGAARNTGIDMASGEFIAFLDADDLWFDNKLQTVYSFIKKQHGDVDVVCHSEEMKRKKISLGVLKHGPYTSYEDLLFKGNSLSPSATCVRKKMLEEVGLFSLDKKGHGVEDWDLWLKLARKNAKIYYIEDVLGVYVLYGDNMSEAPEFHKKGRYVFESHVAKLDNVTADIALKIKGARAVHDIYSMQSYIANNKFSLAIITAWSILSVGMFNQFFWKQVLTKIFSVCGRIFR